MAALVFKGPHTAPTQKPAVCAWGVGKGCGWKWKGKARIKGSRSAKHSLAEEVCLRSEPGRGCLGQCISLLSFEGASKIAHQAKRTAQGTTAQGAGL